MLNLGDRAVGSTLSFLFNTHKADGTPITLAGTPVISVYKNSTTQSVTGVSLTVDYDSVTGMHQVVIDTSADGTFYATNNDFNVVVTTGTVNSISVVGAVVGKFSIGRQNISHMNSIVASSITTINANQGQTQPINFTGTGASAYVKADMVDVAGAAVSTSTAQIGVNAVQHGGTVQTGRDIGASVLLSSGTGTGQLDFTSGVVKANMVQILAAAITGTAANLVASFTKWFNVTSPTGTVNSIPDAVAGANGGLPTTNGTKVGQTVDLTAGQSIACSDKTGFSLAATGLDLVTAASTFGVAIIAGIWAAATSGMSTVGSIGKKLADWVVGTITANQAVNVAQWGGSNIATPAVTGQPVVTLGATQAAYAPAKAGDAMLITAGTGAGQLDVTSGVIKANTTQLAGQTVTAAAGVTFPTSVASPTNITAGTITTATSVTNDVGITQAGADKVWGTAARALTDKAGFSISGTKQTLDALNDVSAATVNSEVDTALTDIKLDHLVAVAESGDVVNSSIIAKLASKSATPAFSSFNNTTDSLEAIADNESPSTVDANITKVDGVTLSTHASGMLPSDVRDIAGAAVSISTAQIGTNVVSQDNIDFGALQKASLNAATPASVGSVTNDVGITQVGADKVWGTTVRALTDKAGFTISGTKQTLDSLNDITAASVWSVATRTLTSFGTLVSDVWSAGTRTLTSFGTLASDVWSAATRTLTSFGTLVSDVWANATRTITGTVTVGTNNDKTGYSISGTKTTLDALNDISAGSILATPANKLATDSSGRVTVGSNADKTGYSISGTKQTLDALNDITAASVWSVATRTLTSFGSLVADVWSYISRTLTSAIAVSKQDVRDAMLLTPTPGAPAAGSIDLMLGTVENVTNEFTFTGNKVNAQIKASDDIDFTPTQLDSLNSIVAAAGAGIYEITVTFLDQYAAPIEMAYLNVLNSGGHRIAYGLSNSSGVATFNVDAGTYTIRSYKAMVSFSDTTVVVTDDAAQMILGTTFTPTPPAPGMQTVYGYVNHGDATAGEDAVVTAVPLFDTNVDNIALTLKEITVVVDTDGYFELELIQRAAYQVSIKYGTKVLSSRQFTVTTDDTKKYEDYHV